MSYEHKAQRGKIYKYDEKNNHFIETNTYKKQLNFTF